MREGMTEADYQQWQGPNEGGRGVGSPVGLK